MRLGIDFDNTLISYDDVFAAAAPSFAPIAPTIAHQKRDIRDYLRTLPDGELTWQRLQGHVYGKGITGARMFEGAGNVLRRCRAEGCEVLIVSHKTEFGHYDPDRVSLRDAARGWMQSQGFFRPDGYGIPAGNVYFESTRAEKLARIEALQCSHFIDDLEEVLDDPGFPPGVERILFSEAGDRATGAPYVICRSWADIEQRLFR